MPERGHQCICSLRVLRDGTGNVCAHETLLTLDLVNGFENLSVIVIVVTCHNGKLDTQLASCL